MVNKIPLGPNAALVMIDKVINKDAYLWRPSEDMTVMGDALFQNIPWPITKVLLSNVEPTEEASQHSKFADFSQRAGPAVCKDSEPPKQSSPKSASTSSNSSSASKKKCFLLDCSGSGKKVAEGRVCSTDPKETVHFVPLGPNASKVWVDVVKIGDARVWRPNSEVEIIADALGTTVAWPSDKIVFM